MSRMGTAVGTPKARCTEDPHSVGEAEDSPCRPGRLEADQAQREMRFGGIIAQGLGQGRLLGQAQQADRQVPQGGHDLWGGVRTDLGAVFAKGHIPDPVRCQNSAEENPIIM